MAEYPGEPEAWALRAHFRTLDEEYDRANLDLAEVIRLAPREPFSFFRRELNLMALGRWGLAVLDFTCGIELGDPDYENAFYFSRAEAFIAVGRKAEARSDLAKVRDGTVMWTVDARSKQELLERLSLG